jgi:hypothetical protein
MNALFTPVSRFDPKCGDAWTKYVAWSGLTHLKEVVSLDGIVCPAVIKELIDEDWQHNVQEDYKVFLFRDLDYLLRRVTDHDGVNFLAIMQNPTVDDVCSFSDPRFEFRGFDLVDVHGDISALVNCGGFAKAFSNAELSECGLVSDHTRAMEIQRQLRKEYADERHAECDVWAIWLMKSIH